MERTGIEPVTSGLQKGSRGQTVILLEAERSRKASKLAGYGLTGAPARSRSFTPLDPTRGLRRGPERGGVGYGSSQLPKSRLISSPNRKRSTSLMVSETPPEPTMLNIWVAVRISSARPPNQIAPLSE